MTRVVGHKFVVLALFSLTLLVHAEPTVVSGILMGKEEVLIKTRTQGEIKSLEIMEGSNVKSGQVLAIIDDEQEKLEKQMAEIEYKKAKDDFEKTKKLEKFVSKEELLTKENEFHKKKTNYEIKLLSFQNTRIATPIAGIVTRRFINKGESVTSGEKAFEVINLQKLMIELDLPYEQIKHLKKGQHLTFSPEVQLDKSYKAGITYIAPVVDKASGTVRLRLELDNSLNTQKEYVLKPGAIVSIKL